ncbi:hypothetical protein PV04_00676 [Phialophora macrospora]|uniref:Uncharacterized protein n=1 Tax=Phialophora macrospora TaxID=1851006 RepID=A0A0D2GJF8_9EURO|nr:hypothetical protein PV04_00676 [Phialophora macrospora]
MASTTAVTSGDSRASAQPCTLRFDTAYTIFQRFLQLYGKHNPLIREMELEDFVSLVRALKRAMSTPSYVIVFSPEPPRRLYDHLVLWYPIYCSKDNEGEDAAKPDYCNLKHNDVMVYMTWAISAETTRPADRTSRFKCPICADGPGSIRGYIPRLHILNSELVNRVNDFELEAHNGALIDAMEVEAYEFHHLEKQ